MKILSSDKIQTERPTTKLSYLFIQFFKIGMVSFGGYMALVAMIQRELVEKDQVIDQEVITDSISIASLLPGPLAVNIVAFVGYQLRKKTGAIVSLIGVLLPASLAMLILSWCYFSFGYKTHWNEVLYYTSGAVAGIILSTGINIHKKDVRRDLFKNVLCALTLILIIFLKGYLVTFSLITVGAVLGCFLRLDDSHKKNKGFADKNTSNPFFNWRIKFAAIFLIFIEASYIVNLSQYVHSIYLKIALIFSGISLSLFGGGYVMIPIMQSLLVVNLKWLSSTEFLDCIAFSQLTPGPILVGSIFVGYKLTGIVGGAVALLAMFGPSAVLMIIASKIFSTYKNNRWLKNALAGVKPVVVGLIIASAYKLLKSLPSNFLILIICGITIFISLKYRVSPVYFILSSLLLGICLTIFHYNI